MEKKKTHLLGYFVNFYVIFLGKISPKKKITKKNSEFNFI